MQVYPIDKMTKDRARLIIEDNIQTVIRLDQELLIAIDQKNKYLAEEEKIMASIANIEIISERLTKFYWNGNVTDNTDNKAPIA